MEQDKAAQPEVMDITLFGIIQPEVMDSKRGPWVLALSDSSILDLMEKKVEYDVLDHTIKLVHDAGREAFAPFDGKAVRVKGTLHPHGMPDNPAAFVHVTAVEISGISNVELVGVLDKDGHWLTVQRASENARHFAGEKVFVWGDLNVAMNKTLDPFKGKACVIKGELGRMFNRPQETWSIDVKEAREPR
jgi:hypothetical protein